MTDRKTAKKEEPKAEHELTAGTAEPDPKVRDRVETTPISGGAEHTVNPPLEHVEEYQSVGVDPEFLADQTVEPDFDKAEHERSLAAGREYLDRRTRNRP